MIRVGLASLLLAVGLALSGSASADEDQDQARRLLQEGRILPLDTILDRTLQLHPGGRVIDTEFEVERDRYVYEVEIVDSQGVVWEVEHDAVTGAVINNEQDD